MFFFKFNRSSYAIMLLAIVVLNLVLISYISPVEASKKKLMKKLKKALPLLLALKSKKKIFLLPIPLPMPMKDSWGGGQMMQMDSWGGGGQMMSMDSWGGGSSGGGGKKFIFCY